MRRNQWKRAGRYYRAIIEDTLDVHRCVRGVWLLGVMAVLAAPACQAPIRDGRSPVAVRPPAELVDKIRGAQVDFVQALGSVATRYDRAVCGELKGQHAGRSDRQAFAEANLEVSRAMRQARGVTQSRGGGPIESDDGITVVEEPVSSPRSGPHWSCVQADTQPECVHASANAVAQRVYRQRVAGYDLDPRVLSDVLSAWAADLRWAGELLSSAESSVQAYRSIHEQCEAGKSPLASYLGGVDDGETASQRQGLKQFQTDLMGMHPDLCSALPALYGQLIQDLGLSLAHHSRTQYCVNRPWPILD